ncbi:hypothetical protein [Arcticibacter tournemirensis]|uniref:Uncharacterized protein n=1 Tax=Arcticibacter tournemirensis TaxID=699437 RepID=A0A4Q0MFX7_9SPHI|nr:hypothetical protein [Arcticibacter tournemirensis]RXF72224.1 hypothetical protein EKH83_00420 [Arcticibacter tournemirensis]
MKEEVEERRRSVNNEELFAQNGAKIKNLVGIIMRQTKDNFLMIVKFNLFAAIMILSVKCGVIFEKHWLNATIKLE